MRDEQMLKIRKLMPNLTALSYRNGQETVLLNQDEIPISELIDILEYVKIFHPSRYKQAVTESKVNEELDKIL